MHPLTSQRRPSSTSTPGLAAAAGFCSGLESGFDFELVARGRTAGRAPATAVFGSADGAGTALVTGAAAAATSTAAVGATGAGGGGGGAPAGCVVSGPAEATGGAEPSSLRRPTIKPT